MSHRDLLRAAGPSLLLAAAYFVSGRLGLLLAIPPGYATAIWPASGVALAGVLYLGYRVWPGVCLGSFLINIWTSLDTSSAVALLGSLLPAAGIAGGAAVQALVGAALIRRWVGYTNLLTQELKAVQILLIGGPVACTISASIGVGTLWLCGIVPASNALVNWWTWWIGDSVGVLIFTPLLLVWTARPLPVWLSRQFYASVPLVLGFGLVVWLFSYVSQREQARVLADFENSVAEFRQGLGRDSKNYLDALYSVQSFYNSAARIEREGFSTFASRLQERLPGLRALSWNPRVVAADRVAFEAAESNAGRPGYSILEKSADGSLKPASARAEYIPVQFIVPALGNAQALGYDVASEAVRGAALRQAVEAENAAATAPIQLVQGSGDAPGVLVFIPVYLPGTLHGSVEQRRHNLRGCAVAVFEVEKMLAAALTNLKSQGIEIRLFDHTDSNPQPLWQSAPPPDNLRGGLADRFALEIASRTWEAELWVPAAYLLAHRSWQTWTLLATGMLFTSLLGMFLLVVIGRSAVIEDQVTERTSELLRANKKLFDETLRSERLEAEARRQNLELEASNQDLEQFAYIASHDLQAPLRSTSGFAEIIERRLADRLDAETRQFLGLIRDSCQRMQGLIEGLLSLSLLSRERPELATVAVKQSVDHALAALDKDLKSCGAQVQHGDFPVVKGDGRLLTQLFQNLIGNAIKFQPKGRQPKVAIGTEAHPGEWLFSVHDNGIGILSDDVGQLFLTFKRLHRSEDYAGHGIGLALCKKIVRLHQGRIWVESTVGQGTTVYFTLPAAA